jgi:hypothetical protein
MSDRPPFVARKRDVFSTGRICDVRICKADSEDLALAICDALNR